jgi:AcrR family transcriptional regulator
MTKIQICYCGSNHDAVDAALRVARQSIRYHYGNSENCTIFLMAVAEAYRNIVVQLTQAALLQTVIEGDAQDGRTHDREQALEMINRKIVDVSRETFAAHFENKEQNADLAKFVCDECGVPPVTRAQIENGPSAESMELAGFEVVSEDVGGAIGELLTELMTRGRKTH